MVDERQPVQGQDRAPGGGGTEERGDGPAPRPRRGGGGGRSFSRRKVCGFCVDGIKHVDYKDVPRLHRYISERGMIEPRRKTGNCAKHQRALAVALKRARHVALLPYTAEHIRLSGMVMRSADDRRRDGDRSRAPVAPVPGGDGRPAPAETEQVADGSPTDDSVVPAADAAPLVAAEEDRPEDAERSAAGTAAPAADESAPAETANA